MCNGRYFLNEVDGIESNNGILIIGSTNHLERLDAAVTKRPSRFDRKYRFDLPSERERILYLEHWRKRLESNDKVDFDPMICDIVVQMTEGFSFAYIKELVMQALLTMARADREKDNESPGGPSNLKMVDDPTTSDGECKADDSVSKVQRTFNRSENGTLEPSIPERILANPFMQTLQAHVATLREDVDGDVRNDDET